MKRIVRRGIFFVLLFFFLMCFSRSAGAEEYVFRSEEAGSGQEESGGTDAQEKVPAADAGFGAAAEILRETLAEE